MISIRTSAPAAALGLALLVSSGCEAPRSSARNQMQGVHNMWVAEDLRTRAIDDAVTEDRIVYEHHFVSGTAELNPLGLRDLLLLAGYYREHDGSLRVRKGEASDELYAARLDAVSAELAVAGVDSDRIAADAARYALEIRSEESGEGSS